MMQLKKRKNSPATDNRPQKQRALSPGNPLTPSISASLFNNSIALTNIAPLSRSPSSVLPAYSASFVRPLSPFTMPSPPSARSIASTLGSGLHSMIPSPLKRHLSPTTGFSYQAAADIDTPVLFEVSYGQTSRAGPSPLDYNIFAGPASSRNLHTQGDAIYHFQLNVVAPVIENDSTAALPAGWTQRDGTMIDPALYEAQYSTALPGHDSIASTSTQVALQQPSPGVPSYPATCFICNPPQDSGEVLGTIYDTSEDFDVHLWEAHMESSEWVERECLFAHCSSHEKAIRFLTVKLWLAHVRNVHHKSYYCFHPSCKYRFDGPTPKAFGSQSVLNRHGLSRVHATPVYCDKPRCTGRDNLARKDKYNKHQAEYHGPYLCSATDCPRARHVNGISYGFASAKDLATHEKNEKHGRNDDGGREVVPGYGMTTAQDI